jgi:hypothetical protein
MPNNSNARQKKQSKKKKTDPPPLHKEDKARVDSTSLALAGKDKASVDSISLLLLQERIKPAWITPLFLLQERIIKPARISLSFLLSQEKTAKRLSASAQPTDAPKDSPKDSEISLLYYTGGGKHDGRFGEAVAKGKG